MHIHGILANSTIQGRQCSLANVYKCLLAAKPDVFWADFIHLSVCHFIVYNNYCRLFNVNKLIHDNVSFILAHPIRISEILPGVRNSYLALIKPRMSLVLKVMPMSDII